MQTAVAEKKYIPKSFHTGTYKRTDNTVQTATAYTNYVQVDFIRMAVANHWKKNGGCE